MLDSSSLYLSKVSLYFSSNEDLCLSTACLPSGNSQPPVSSTKGYLLFLTELYLLFLLPLNWTILSLIPFPTEEYSRYSLLVDSQSLLKDAAFGVLYINAFSIEDRHHLFISAECALLNVFYLRIPPPHIVFLFAEWLYTLSTEEYWLYICIYTLRHFSEGYILTALFLQKDTACLYIYSSTFSLNLLSGTLSSLSTER